MSLLSDLRAAAPTDAAEPPWMAFKRVMPLLVPGFELTKMEVFSDGRVGVRARSPMQGKGRFYVVLVMDKVGTGTSDGRRAVRMGVSQYRDEADAMIFNRPFYAVLDPQPGAVGAWVAGILLTQDQHSAHRQSAMT